MTSFMLDSWVQDPFSNGAAEKILKTFRNALLISAACTAMLFAYYTLSGQSEEIPGLWVSAIALFFGVFGYLLFAGRKKRSRHRK